MVVRYAERVRYFSKISFDQIVCRFLMNCILRILLSGCSRVRVDKFLGARLVEISDVQYCYFDAGIYKIHLGVGYRFFSAKQHQFRLAMTSVLKNELRGRLYKAEIAVVARTKATLI
ncbi:hypothetical protein MC45_08590 [Sphingomonas taxi]|uniref:Uncharacterized protein n=1 Tax=Sphingomonas taxi TaxID=1549858 RepID=A0A097EFR6_9SPHN|nr:hypothetical protein MC45_08590 [Sphingomonas taxi]